MDTVQGSSSAAGSGVGSAADSDAGPTVAADAAVEQSPATTIDELVDVLDGRRILAVTGAGVSTDSGIPDYRGEGAPKRTPMTFKQFAVDPDYRKRYWAGSHLGWTRFSAARPNAGHLALATLEERGIVTGVVTQNVDGLHIRAGSRRVVDLHGSGDRVTCMTCGQMFARDSIADRISILNPWIGDPGISSLNPDGDAEVHDVSSFVVPECSVCGGVLKPDIVFFGEFIPSEKFQEAKSLVGASDALLVAGSSLVVNSGIRLVELARRKKIPIVIVNRGVTKGDNRATLKLEAGTSQTLTALAERLTPLA